VANRDEGLLFWLAWLGHNGNSVFGSADAHGPFRALTQTTTCTTIQDEIAQQPTVPLEFLQGLTGVLFNLCGGSGVLPPVPNIPLPHGARGGKSIVTRQEIQTMRRIQPALSQYLHQLGARGGSDSGGAGSLLGSVGGAVGNGVQGVLPGGAGGGVPGGQGGLPGTGSPGGGTGGGAQGATGPGTSGPSGPLGVLEGAAGRGH
jgi:hypothetical protein